MNTLMNDGIVVYVDGKDRQIYIDGFRYRLLAKMTGNNLSVINGKIYVDGYEFKKDEFGNVKWKRTFKSMWHKYF